MIEKILFKKVEMWVICVLVLAGTVVTLIFGMIVNDIATGTPRVGSYSAYVKEVVSLHTTFLKAVKELRHPGGDLIAQSQRFPGQSGFSFAYAPGTRPDAPYILVNRYDGDKLRSVSELVDLNSQDVVKAWTYDVDPIWKETASDSPQVNLQVSAKTTRFRGTHADLASDGGLVVEGMGSPLLKFDLCGKFVWAQPEAIFHHSLERDADGNFWGSASLGQRSPSVGDGKMEDNALTKISPEGVVLYRKSILEILDENGMGQLVRARGPIPEDPIHLNDIQPILKDGVLWKKGDVLFSSRNLSMIALFRPETGKILWSHADGGAWIHQHDVNVLDDRHISVFDNNAPTQGDDNLVVNKVNRLIIMDVTTGEYVSSHAAGFEALDIRTQKQGRGTLLDDGHLFVEETAHGRALAFDEAGTVDWSFVNRATKDGKVYLMNWSRIIPRATGDAVRAHLAEGTCTRT